MWGEAGTRAPLPPSPPSSATTPLYGPPTHTHLRVDDLLRHLGVREVLIDHNALDELGLAELASRLALHLNHIEVDVVVLEVGHSQHGLDRDLGHVVFVHVDDLRRKRGLGRVE